MLKQIFAAEILQMITKVLSDIFSVRHYLAKFAGLSIVISYHCQRGFPSILQFFIAERLQCKDILYVILYAFHF